jgi:hypothetical protein
LYTQNGTILPSGSASWMQHRKARATSNVNRSMNPSMVTAKTWAGRSPTVSICSNRGPHAAQNASSWPLDPAGFDLENSRRRTSRTSSASWRKASERFGIEVFDR